jgi:FkbM family methyltransferase
MISCFRVARGILEYIWRNPSNEGQRIYRTCLAVLWQVYKRTVRLPLIITLDNGVRYIAEPAATNSTGAIYTRLYEPEYMMFVRKHLVSEPKGAMIDVGANSGLWTLLLRHLLREGLCFEPAPDTARWLKHNIAINEMEAFAAIPRAVSDKDGTCVLAVAGAYSCTNRLASLRSAVPAASQATVQTVSIDSYLERYPLKSELTFLKIDTEGHELAVFRGAQRTLRSSPRALVLWENSDFDAISGMFREMGWFVFGINRSEQIDSDAPDLRHAYNLLACGPEHPLHRELAASRANMSGIAR